ncbi:uncharacterized protein [Littorina saxatilis]|uniref:Fork-head domain-containing protein n=1 Tax=Littorina saxatilis TaxID=31220 RepID=A0AAN9C289_9CAEN
MCTPNHNALLSYAAGLKVPTPSPYFSLSPAASQLTALDFHRSQFCDYRQLLNIRQYQALHASGLGPYAAYLDPYTQYLYKGDPRARFVQEEPKPAHSYIGLIAMAILSSKENKLVLSDIYQWILDNYPYFRTRGPGWRNSIRHNLSLNDCFIKSGRSANGKGHYWAVHPANVDDFSKGDFRRRRAQRKVRKHMGLSVPDDEDDSPSPSPNPFTWPHNGQEAAKDLSEDCDNNNLSVDGGEAADGLRNGDVATVSGSDGSSVLHSRGFVPLPGSGTGVPHVSKKRQFDMESLLAPDYPMVIVPKVRLLESAASTLTAHQGHHSDLDSTTSEQRHGCLSDDSDVDIEVEDVDDKNTTLDSDKDREVGENESQLLNRSSDSGEMGEADISDKEEEEEEERQKDIQIKVESGDSSEERGNASYTDHHNQVSTATSTSSPFTTPTRNRSTSSSSSALDLSSSSSSPSSSVASLSVMSSGPSPAQTLLLPRSLDAGQRARWMGLGMGVGLGAVGLGGPVPGADLGLRRYSAFHAAGGSGNPGLRGSLASSVGPFIHPVFAAARYPSLVPLGASPSPSASSISPASSALGVAGSDPVGRGLRLDNASQVVTTERL